jgi:cyclopropane-fatty-acyl-phospholipid synthase
MTFRPSQFRLELYFASKFEFGGKMRKFVRSPKEALLDALFEGYAGPAFEIRLWDGLRWFSLSGEKPVCTIVIESPQALTALVAEPNEITLGEAFIYGDLDVEGDIFSVFSIAEYLFNRPRPLRQQILEKTSAARFGLARWFKHGSQHSMQRDRASISYHYDQPVAFFEPWLGQTLAYSCAYFRCAGDSLDVAQEQKLDVICRKLRLQSRERFLDIGCGWGSLVMHAAGKYHVHAQGITISREQEEVAKRRIAETNWAHRCAVELRDYRESSQVRHTFDKIASVGMFEHVGLRNLRPYFRTVHGLMRPGGVFLNHGITRSCTSAIPAASFIDRYVFPDGHLVTLPQVLEAAESQGFEVRDVENLREHYALTLRRWVDALRQNSETVLQHVSNVTYRIWLLYMAGSAAAFRRGDIAVHQVLLSRPDRGQTYLPLTREDWYSVNTRQEVEACQIRRQHCLDNRLMD